jgi:hypothetical protein
MKIGSPNIDDTIRETVLLKVLKHNLQKMYFNILRKRYPIKNHCNGAALFRSHQLCIYLSAYWAFMKFPLVAKMNDRTTEVIRIRRQMKTELEIV